MKANQTTIFLAFLVIFFSSCEKRDRLDGDMEQYVGTWEWYETTGSGNTNTDGYYNSTPASTGNTYRIQLKKNGRFKTWKNGEVQNKGVLRHTDRNSVTLYDKDYELYTALQYFDNDTMRISHFPFDVNNLFQMFERVD